jgi:hypothetical protein
MKRLAALLLCLAVSMAGCGRTATSTPGDPGPDDKPAIERMIGIYSAVIRRLVTVDHTFGSERFPFDRVFIVDGVAPDVGPSVAVPASTVKTFSPEVRAGILAELADLPPVEFVSDPDSVVVGKSGCARVTGNGVLITLGPITGGEDRVTVPNSLFFACLGGQWLSYVLEREDGDWRVVGTKGPLLIS